MEKLMFFLGCCILTASAQSTGDLRLMEGTRSGFPDGTAGRVEIYMNGEWGTVKYDSSNDQEGVGQVICKQLGLVDVDSVRTVSKFNIPSADSSVPVNLEDVSCLHFTDPKYAEEHILRCDYDLSTSYDHSDDMGVVCSNHSLFNSYETQVRLVQTNKYHSEGFVEINLQGSWGPVCNLEQGEADSVCRQLGYTHASSVGSSSNYNNPLSNDQLDGGYKCSRSYPCFRSCFDYPSDGDYGSCYGVHSTIKCSYVISDEDIYTSGGYPLCSYSTTLVIGLIVGIAVAALLVLLLIICVPVCICCCCIPGCVVYNSRKRVVYQTIQ